MPSEQVSSGHIYHASARREQVSKHWLQYTGSCKSNYYTITTTTAPDKIKIFWFGFVVFNVTFNTISVITVVVSLLMEETGVPGENHW